MSEGGKVTARHPRGEDPTATGFNPLYAGPAAASGGRRRKDSEGRKDVEVAVASDEESIYAEVFPTRYAPSRAGAERRCGGTGCAELFGYLICPLTALFLALGAFAFAVLMLTGVLAPLGHSKEFLELRSAVEALQQSLSPRTAPSSPPGVPLKLNVIDFGNCTELRFSCSLNATSTTCGLDLGPVKPSYILQNDSLRLTTEQCWYHPLQAVDASHVSMQYFLREVSFGSYSSADVFCIVNGNLGQDERGEVHLYHRDCSLKDYVLLTL